MSPQVFGDYDQAALELQYNSSARSPEINALRDREAARTAALSKQAVATLPCRLDLAYGSGARETFDAFFPDGSNAPVMIFIHGGYWKSRDKGQFAWLAKPFVQHGIGFISLEYPLCPDVTLTQLVDATLKGIAHIHANAAALGFDRRRIALSGHSAGGHLAAMAMATDWTRYNAAQDLLRSVTAISGLYDLRPLKLVAVNADLRLTDTEVRTLSPVGLPPRASCPFGVTVGADEGDEFKRNAHELATAWTAAGLPVTTLPAPGRYHFDVLRELGEADGSLFPWAADTLLG